MIINNIHLPLYILETLQYGESLASHFDIQLFYEINIVDSNVQIKVSYLDGNFEKNLAIDIHYTYTEILWDMQFLIHNICDIIRECEWRLQE